MGMKNLRFKYCQAVGLLELMLALALIAIILIMTTRYYTAASGSQKVDSATQMVISTRAAVDEYMAGNPNATVPSVTELVQAGLLPTTFLNGSNDNNHTVSPWATAPTSDQLSISAATGGFSVTMITPTASVCSALSNQLQSTIEGGASGASNSKLNSSISCSTATLTATFYFGTT